MLRIFSPGINKMEHMAIGDEYLVRYPHGKPAILRLTVVHDDISRHAIRYTFIDLSGTKVHFTNSVVKSITFDRISPSLPLVENLFAANTITANTIAPGIPSPPESSLCLGLRRKNKSNKIKPNIQMVNPLNY